MMRLSKRFVALLTACTLLLVFAASAGAAAPTLDSSLSGKLAIIHTNDTHGRDVAVEGKCIGTAGVAALKKDLEAQGASVLLVSAGDFSQGTTLVSLDNGASAVEFMNAAGYDAAAPGNHEFDYKIDVLRSNVSLAKFPVLAANIVDASTGKPFLTDAATFDTRIGKVGVFGLATPETMTKAHPDNIKGLTIYENDALVTCAQQQADALRQAGCVYVVALCHLGVSPESAPNRSEDVFSKVTGVDLIIDGHSHTEMAGDSARHIGDALAVSTGEYLKNVGVVVTDGKTEISQLISAENYTKVDEPTAAVINKRDAEVSSQLSQAFATSEVKLNGDRDPGNRTEETNLGDFAADAVLWSAKKALGDDKVDCALTNGGGIRASIEPGAITMNTMKTVFPFGNEVATIEVTGAQLLEALEAATFAAPTAAGAFPQVSGISFTVDTRTPYASGAKYPDSTYYAPAAPGSRVQNELVGGQPLDLNKTYTLATNDFTAAGGDTYGVFIGKSVYKTGVALEDALVRYTQSVLGGTVTAEKYGKPQGRITVVKTPISDLSLASHPAVGDTVTGLTAGKRAYVAAEILPVLKKLTGSSTEICSPDGNALAYNAPVTTGTIARWKDGDDQKTAKIIVAGDVTCTGKMNLSQVVALAQASQKHDTVPGHVLAAGDHDNSGDITINDIVKQVKLLTAA